MRRQRLAVLALIAGCALPLVGPVTSLASQSSTFTTNVTVGASRTLPNGSFAYSDGCEVGYSGSTEFRCSFEFGISIPSTAKILSATLNVKKTAGPNCALSDCPVDVYGYNGNGSSDLSDVSQGTLVRIFYPNGNVQGLDVSSDLQARVSNGLAWMGYRMSRDSSSTRSPDVQDFDISGATRVSLSVSYVAQPVDVTVHLGGSGSGVVTSNPSGISCGEFCTATFEYAEPVTLTATPQNGSTFDHWDGGECDGSPDPACNFIVPALNMDTTAVFDPPIGPPVSAPPSPTPNNLTPPPLTPPPLPTGQASTGPHPTGGPGATGAPAPTDVIASDGTVITPPPPTLAPGETPTPTILGLGDEADTSSGGIPLPLVILLILVLGGLVGGGVYWYTKRQQAAGP
jgi:hypothetical protein